MAFRVPTSTVKKRKSSEKIDSFKSPPKRPKQLSSVQSPIGRRDPKNDIYFDDGFSQYFHTQFIREISNEEALNTTAKALNSNGYNSTQIAGFTQALTESQFETTITPAQRMPTQATILSPKPRNTQALLSQRSQQSSSRLINSISNGLIEEDDDENANVENQDLNEVDHVQSSQIFLKEITALHFNISSMIDETLLANKTEYSDDAAEGKFTVFKSNVTMSEYVQIKRQTDDCDTDKNDKPNMKKCDKIETNAIEEQSDANPIVSNTELIDDQLLAEFLENNDFENDSKFNECIDPNSSALQTSLLEANAADADVDNEVAANQEHFSDDTVFETLLQRTQSEVNHQIQQLENGISTETTIEQDVENKLNAGPVTAAHYYNLGPFFGLPENVKRMIKDIKGIDDLYDWQKECLQLPAIEKRQNLIYALPTSGGKTLVSEILIFREIMCRRRNCLFILPYVSIVQEKVWALSQFALHLDFMIEEYAAGKGCIPPRKRHKKKSVYIATIEKAMVLFDSLIENNRANEIGLVIVDELHIIGESGRGAVMEALLTKIQYIKAGIQIVGMSATIGNLKDLAQFLNADIYHKDFRPVELREFIKCGIDLLEVKKDAIDIESTFVHERTVSFGYNDEVQKMDPDHIAGLVSEIIPEKSCLIFCPSKKNCENLSTLLCNILSKKYKNHAADKKKSLIKAIETDMGSQICPVLAKTIPYGIAYHHSGLTADERRHLEDAFRSGVLCVICCTSNLAAGVNLPAKRVIIRSPYVGREFITLSKYKQMIGRAGRAGYNETGESILICSARDNQQVSQLLCSPMDEVNSQLHCFDARTMATMLLSCVGLNIASTRSELQKLISFTLLNVQAERLGIDPAKLIDELITKLIKSKTLTAVTDGRDKSRNTSDDFGDADAPESSFSNVIALSQKKVVLKPSTKLEVSIMGRSSFKSGIDLNKAKLVYAELMQAQRSLVLLDYFHLLFIVTPFDENTMMPDKGTFYAKYSKLTPNQQHTAQIIGITNSVAMKLMSGQQIKPEQERVVKKFFLTMVLNELWQMKPISDIAHSFGIGRGLVQNLMGMAAIEASCLLKFCEELEEFWAFRDLFKNLSQRLSNICSVELVPLMQLPCVKIGRAKQLYNAGYKKIEDVARLKARDLVANIEHMSTRVANQLISAAKVLVLEKLENLREEVQECMDVYTS